MFNNLFFRIPDDTEDKFSKLERLAEIEDKLEELMSARHRLLGKLGQMRNELEGHRRDSVEVRMRAMELLNQVSRRIEQSPEASLSRDEERLLYELDARRQQLEKEVSELERKLKVATFEAESLDATLDELKDLAATLEAELDDGEYSGDSHRGN